MRAVGLITNPAAGKGRAVRARDVVLPLLQAAGVRVESVQGRDADEALHLAHRLVASGVEALVVVGGDGMANLGLQATAGTEVPLGIVPAGTGNDIARCVGLAGPRGAPVDPNVVVRRILDATPRRIDLARIGERYFATVLAAGFDAVVNERANRMRWPRGQARYNLATVAELRTFRPISYVLDLEGPDGRSQVRTEAMLVAVGNGPSFGGGLRIAEGARLDDGLLDVVVIGPMSRAKLLRTYPKLFSGTHVHEPEFTRHRVSRVTVVASGIVGYADGERFGPLPMTVECEPGLGRVL